MGSGPRGLRAHLINSGLCPGQPLTWASRGSRSCGRGSGRVGSPLSSDSTTELHTERSLHRDAAPAAEHHAGLLAAGLRLRVHLHCHAQPAAPVQLRLGEAPLADGRAGLPAAQGLCVFKGTS